MPTMHQTKSGTSRPTIGKLAEWATTQLPWAKRTALKDVGPSPATVRRFGLLSYPGGPNIGDDIQALAALQFMPRVDYHVDRDSLGEFAPSTADEKIKIILNGWFLASRSWPPAPSLSPLFVSFHISQYQYHDLKDWGGTKFLLGRRSIAYLKEHEPIGCRDIPTLRLLEAEGVDAYFSGCLTLTLGSVLAKNVDAADRQEILLVEPNVDLRTLFESIPAHLREKTSFVSHLIGGLTGPPELRLQTARAVLDRYAAAKLVITSRLHCALPCLALGTPILFVPPKHDLGRFSGILELLNVPRVSDGVISEAIPWDSPAPNPDKHHSLVEQLTATCRKFLIQVD
jgi:hypothetical protein